MSGENWLNSFLINIFYINIILFIHFLPCLCCVSQEHPKALVISFDGFRYNYPNYNNTPTLMQLIMEGTRAEYIKNVFETKTFPNHHSIATGLYPDFHGVIANSFYDPKYERVLNYSEEMWRYNNEILPIWIHNEESGDGRYSGVYMWPGSNYIYNGKLPTFVQKFDPTVQWTERVDTVVSWFLHPETPANLVMMYFEEPDSHSHYNGPDSMAVEQQIKRIDETIRYMLHSFAENGLASVVNFFFLSDHGMAAVPPDNLINVTHIIKSHGNHCIMAGTSPVLHVIPQTGWEDEMYDALKNLSEHHQFSVFWKHELPEQWLYKNSRRIPPIMVVAEEGYAFDDIWRKDIIMYGVHGYDNAFKNMHPFFVAYGPRIKQNFTTPPFNSVDLFSLFCDVLHLQMRRTNGTLENVKEMLLPDKGGISCSIPISNAVLAALCLFALLMGILAAVLVKNLYNKFVKRKYDSDRFNVSKEFENIHLLDSDDME